MGKVCDKIATGIYISESLREQIKAIAKTQDRSLSGQISWMLKTALKTEK